MIKTLLHHYNNFEAITRLNLTNHITMGMYALYRMGGTRQHINEFAKKYIEENQLEKLSEPTYEINSSNFHQFLGKHDAYSAYVRFFKSKITYKNKLHLFKIYLNKMIDGASGGAFHGIIRMAYAYELDELDEISKALAYMATCYEPLTISSRVPITNDPIKVIEKLSQNDYYKTFNFNRSLISGRMRDIFEDEAFLKHVTLLDQRLISDEIMCEVTLELYARTKHFTMLHGFTATHALKVLSPVIENYHLVLNKHWINLQLAYLSTQCVELQPMPQIQNILVWKTILEKAIESSNVHTIKLIYSLYEQSKNKDDKLYRFIAQQKILEA